MFKKIILIAFAALFFAQPIIVAAEGQYKYIPGWYFEYKIPLEEKTIIIKGETRKEQFGAALAKGDLNNDGIDDIAIGSPYFSTKEKQFAGKVSVVLGRKSAQASSNSVIPSAITIIGEGKNHQLGTSVVFGDFNGDQIEDLVIGSINADKVYLFFGKNTKWPEQIDLSRDPADITFKTAALNENFGFSLDMADINKDGIDDLIIGAPASGSVDKTRSGKIYVVFGYKYPSPQFVYDFAKIPPQMIIWGEEFLDQFGASISHGDINNDGRIDIIIGAYASGESLKPEIGRVYIFYGKHPDDLTVYNKYPIEIKSPDIIITGQGARNWFGYSVAGGDLNNDKIDDAIIGSFMYQSDARTGKAHIFYGLKTDQKIYTFLTNSNSSTMKGTIREDDVLGASVAIGDVNNDNKNDFIVGAPGIGDPVANSPGHVFVYNMPTKEPVMMIEGERQNDLFGSAIVVADFNNDGIQDLIISAPNAYNSGKREGAVYIILGEQKWLGAYRYRKPDLNEELSRGQFAYEFIREFNLDSKNKNFLAACYENPEFCLVKFISKTLFRGIKFSPPRRSPQANTGAYQINSREATPQIILYPDVAPDNIFSKEITEAAMLGIMEGFMTEKNSLFKPDEKIQRIHSLRVLLEASGMIAWKDYSALKTELGSDKAVYSQKTPFKDISASVKGAWWYPRYINYAYLSGIITNKDNFRPNEPIKQKEFEEWAAAIKRITE